MTPRKILFIFGTRPEAIKLCPLIREMSTTADLRPVVLVTGQHREMLDQVLHLFDVKPDHDLRLMAPGQSPSSFTATCLRELEPLMRSSAPDLVVVQGDTSSAFAGALAAFFAGLPVAHVEAGLRTYDLAAPFPEEGLRQLVSRVTTLHLAPTAANRRSLESEKVGGQIHVVGNTVIDALFQSLELIQRSETETARLTEKFRGLDFSRKTVLVTAHRRENFGRPLENVVQALRELSAAEPDVSFFVTVHPNPAVKNVLEPGLAGLKNVVLSPPLDYFELIWLMSRCHFVLTDSGGLQEEAPSLGKPVLVLRDSTERPEGIEAGTNRLVGTNIARIVTESRTLLHNRQAYEEFARQKNPFGDGSACNKIIEILRRALTTSKAPV